jgi:hypothetical protein
MQLIEAAQGICSAMASEHGHSRLYEKKMLVLGERGKHRHVIDGNHGNIRN